ncbi:MAG: TIGR04255 family protein, partial [Pirellulales bacterium]|nr:TIGR04255 family protein [Pirellulales bacterium]
DADDRLIQLQPGRFLFNWRSREEAGPYPHYESLSGDFFALFYEFERFVAEQGLGDIEPIEYELTYINHVIEEEGWTFPEHINRVVNEVSWQSQNYQFLPNPDIVIWQCRFEFKDQSGGLSIKLNPGRRPTDDKKLFLLELSARGLPVEGPRDHIEQWFSNGHEWIVRGFEDFTSEEAQIALWGKHELR